MRERRGMGRGDGGREQWVGGIREDTGTHWLMLTI